MNYLLNLISLLVIVCPLIVNAQKSVTVGSIRYNCIHVENGGMQGYMMKSSTQVVYFGKYTTRISFTAMGGMFNTQFITNHKTESTTMLMKIPMTGKYKVKYSSDELQERRNKAPNYSITYDKKKTKEIKGYTCYYAELKTKDATITAYITDKITPKYSPFLEMFPKLNGFPLQFDIRQGEMKLTYKADKIYDKIMKGDFKFSTKDYEEMTPAEFRKKMQDRQGK